MQNIEIGFEEYSKLNNKRHLEITATESGTIIVRIFFYCNSAFLQTYVNIFKLMLDKYKVMTETTY